MGAPAFHPQGRQSVDQPVNVTVCGSLSYQYKKARVPYDRYTLLNMLSGGDIKAPPREPLNHK